MLSTGILGFGADRTHAALFLSIYMELVSEQVSKTHLQRVTHVVEDVDDNQYRHASIQLEQQRPLKLLPRLGATKLGV